MEKVKTAVEIKAAIEAVEASLKTLATVGEGVPAVERNAKRLLGSLRALEIQFSHIPQAVMDKLLNYPWPGNVRELQNVIERAVILSPNSTLQIPELVSSIPNTEQPQTLSSLASMEKNHISKILEHTGWQISGEQGAASILEMHPNTLRSRMSKLGIRRD